MIHLKELIQSSEALTEAQGVLLDQVLMQQFQLRDVQDVIEVSFKGIEKVSLTFFTKAFDRFNPEQLITRCVFKDIETREILDLIKRELMNKIMLWQP